MRGLLNAMIWVGVLSGIFYLTTFGFEENEKATAILETIIMVLWFLAGLCLFIAATRRVPYKDKTFTLVRGRIELNGRAYSIKKIKVNTSEDGERVLGHFICLNNKTYFVEKVNKLQQISDEKYSGDVKLESFSKNYDFYFAYLDFRQLKHLGPF